MEQSGSALSGEAHRPLVDGFGRRVSYLRVSVTDRCDLRCGYCMPVDPTFRSKRDILGLEELDRLCSAFVAMGTRKLRLTGGEPLVRRDVLKLFRSLSRHLHSGGLDELTLTTNGTRLAEHAEALADCGVRRVNVSLDTLDRERFRRLTGADRLEAVIAGIKAARAVGLRVKLNVVALKGVNEDDFVPIVEWAHGREIDCTFIEVMPLGAVEVDRRDHFLPIEEVRRRIEARWATIASIHDTGGPSRYRLLPETGHHVGFISAVSRHFCDSCNRTRLTSTGELFTCLARTDAVDLRSVMRTSGDGGALEETIRRALANKAAGHDFETRLFGGGAVDRHMNVTGG